MSSLLRERLTQTLRTDSELNAFCFDHFQEVYSQFTGGMDRTTKHNLLLALASPDELYRSLNEHAQKQHRAQTAPVDLSSSSAQIVQPAGVIIGEGAYITGGTIIITINQTHTENDDLAITQRISASINDKSCKKTLTAIDPRQIFTVSNVSCHLDKFLSEKINSAKVILILVEVVHHRMKAWFPAEQSLSRSYMPETGSALFLWQRAISQSIGIGIRAAFALLLCAQDYINEPLPFLYDLIDNARKIGDAP